jgi:hypothetical protein
MKATALGGFTDSFEAAINSEDTNRAALEDMDSSLATG